MPSGEIYIHDIDKEYNLYKSGKELLSKKEIKELLKNTKKEYSLWKCKDCPLYSLEIREKVGCVDALSLICGIKPTTCYDAIRLINDFLKGIKKNNQNKI